MWLQIVGNMPLAFMELCHSLIATFAMIHLLINIGRCCPVVVADLSLAAKKSEVTRRSFKLRALKPFSGQFSATACESSCGCMGACEETEFLDEEQIDEIENEILLNGSFRITPTMLRAKMQAIQLPLLQRQLY